MLIEFKVKNFRSIQKEIIFSLLASSDKSHNKNIIEKEALKKDRILKSAVIYGANASGKSNVLSAINIMRNLVINSHNYQKGVELDHQPFRLNNKEISKPTEMSIVFIKDEIQYDYSFTYDEIRIINEKLYHYPKGRRALIFQRKNTQDYKFTDNQKNQLFLSEKTSENVLYLSRATQLNNEATLKTFNWFKDNLRVILPHLPPTLLNYTSNMIKDASKKKKIMNALEAADLGIDDIIAENSVIKPEDLPGSMPEELKSLIIGSEQYKIRTIHNGIEFDLSEDESEGTQRLYSLMGPLIDALENERVLIIDELDTKLHHLLNLFILDLFHCSENSKSQILFTTHNTNLLDQDIFRRDQIWFTEKNPESGATELFSLLDFHPRNDANIQRGYLSGRYGALPFIKHKRLFK